jgi:hypothetical protein
VGRKVGPRRAQCAAWTRYSIMQIITITQILAIVYYKIRHCHWNSMTNASRCNPLRVSAQKAGAHLFFNAFWLIPHFCVNLMYMRDPMHQIDNGIIIAFLKAILRKYRECVESTLGKIGLAAKKLTLRLKLLLRKYTNVTGHR